MLDKLIINRLVLIDGHALIHRAYHAFPNTLTTSKGELTNAVYGFTSILLATIKDLKPKYMAVAFDKKGPTFRHKKFKEYKGTRAAPDIAMLKQIPRIKEIVKALNIPIFEERGFEADDVIGTLAKQVSGSGSEILTTFSNPRLNRGFGGQACQHGSLKKIGRGEKVLKFASLAATKTLKLSNSNNLDVVIVTGDQDALQLVNDKVKVYMPPRGRFVPAKMYDDEAVMVKIGLKPEQIVDFKALTGDASDNIPGVDGIGPKTAQELLCRYRTLKNIYANLPNLPNTVREKLEKGKDSAFLSQELAQIHYDAPVKLDLEKCLLSDYHKEETIKLFEELEFKSLIKRLPDDGWEKMAEGILGNGKKVEEVDKSSKKVDKRREEEKNNQMGLF